MTSKKLAILTVVATLSVASLPVGATMLGDASGYNVFIFGSGSFDSRFSDTMGNLAAGGNVTLNGYGVAQAVTSSPRLVVGGVLTVNSAGGQVGAGGDGTVYTNQTPVLNGSLTATGGIHPITATQISNGFGADQGFYAALSSELATVGGSQVSAQNGSVTFNATQPGENVFTINAAALSGANIAINNLGTGATVLINVTGSGPLNFTGGMSINGLQVSPGSFMSDAALVLFNLPTVSSINIQNIGLGGSILAPDAAVTGTSGTLDGQLIAESYADTAGSGSGLQFNDDLFAGNLPAAVPLPGTFGLLMSALAAFGAFGLVRRSA